MPEHLFVSYRSSQRDLAMRLSQIGRTAGLLVDTIELDLECPYPHGSAQESNWLTEQFAERIHLGCTFIMIASEDSRQSRWLLWEAMEGFTKAERVLICWVSGDDPYHVVFPLQPHAYHIMNAPLSFLIDGRSGPSIVENAVSHILKPNLRYRVMLRITQLVVAVISIALLFSPVTVLLVAQTFPAPVKTMVTAALLRPWVAWSCLLLAMIFMGIFYPSYQGPLRLARKPTDRFVRVITRGRTGPRWSKLMYGVTFVGACLLNNIHLLSLKSASTVPLVVWIEAAIGGALFSFAYERLRFNLFTLHLGAFKRQLDKYYGFDL